MQRELDELRKRLLELEVSHDTLAASYRIMEQFFIREYPKYFAGEVGTVVDPAIKPIHIEYVDSAALNERLMRDERH